MTKHKDVGGSGGGNQPPKPDEPDSEHRQPTHRPEGREHQVHMEILDRRMRGGPPPTAEAYARALDQWKKLPGSIVRPATDIEPPAEESPPGPAGDGTPAPDKD